MVTKDFENIILEKISSMENSILDKLTIIEKDVSGLKRDVSGLKEDVSGLKEDVSGLKEDVSSLKDEVKRLDKKMDAGFDRLENLINEQTTELSQRIDHQGQYINQAFEVISRMQLENMQRAQGKF